MAKTTAPLLSFSASGAIAKTQVYSRWRGIPYVRRHVTPANPRSTEQTATRNLFRELNNIWVNSPPLFRAPWDLFSRGRPFVDRNAFIGQNVTNMRGEANANAFVASPGARGGVPPTSITPTPGDGQISVAFTNPTAPQGWTLLSAIAVAIQDFEPGTAFAGPVVVDEDDDTQATVLLEGLENDTLHQVAGWLQWEKPDGTFAYSPSINVQSTPTT